MCTCKEYQAESKTENQLGTEVGYIEGNPSRQSHFAGRSNPRSNPSGALSSVSLSCLSLSLSLCVCVCVPVPMCRAASQASLLHDTQANQTANVQREIACSMSPGLAFHDCETGILKLVRLHKRIEDSVQSKQH